MTAVGEAALLQNALGIRKVHTVSGARGPNVACYAVVFKTSPRNRIMHDEVCMCLVAERDVPDMLVDALALNTDSKVIHLNVRTKTFQDLAHRDVAKMEPVANFKSLLEFKKVLENWEEGEHVSFVDMQCSVEIGDFEVKKKHPVDLLGTIILCKNNKLEVAFERMRDALIDRAYPLAREFP